jgi:hypothetical protein
MPENMTRQLNNDRKRDESKNQLENDNGINDNTSLQK